MQRLGDAGAVGGEDHGRTDRGQPLGDAAIAHLQRGGRADRALDRPEHQTAFVQPFDAGSASAPEW